MKWFQHWADSHTNKKGRKILRNQGIEGYAIWWICREMVAKEGKNYRLSASDEWKKTLIEVSGKNGEALAQILKYHAEIGAISSNALKTGDLYIPKMKEYSDNWTKKLQRDSRDTSEKLPIDKIILDKIRIHYIELKGWKEENLSKNDFGRIHRAIKELVNKARGDVDYAIKTINWVAATCKNKGLLWTLETVCRWYPEYYKQYPPQDKTPQKVKDLVKDITK